MRYLLALLMLVLLVGEAQAQSTVVNTCGTLPQTYSPGSTRYNTVDINGNLCTTASVSASIAGWPTAQTTGTPLAVTTTSGAGVLPAGTVVIASNTSTTTPVYCSLGASATVNAQLIAPSSWLGFTVGGNTQIACITSSGTATVNLAGGSGLPTGAGGGGGGGGGSGSNGSVGTPPAVPGQATWLGVNVGGTFTGVTGTGTSINANITNLQPLGLQAYTGSTSVVGSPSTPGGEIAPSTSPTGLVLKASAGIVTSVQLGGIGSTPAYLKLYNKATAPTCGTDTPVKRLIIPAAATAANGAGSNITFSAPITFTIGIGYCVTGGLPDADTTALAANTVLVNIDWQ